jgi:alpha-N-arabinofuranosidase
MEPTRRELLATSSAIASNAEIVAGSGTPTAAAQTFSSLIRIDPIPLFPISPYLYMQFMEPLGVTDSAVEAAWDYDADGWRRDFVDAVQDLAPGVIRWGGLLSRYYRWRDGVGPAAGRRWMRNYQWGGWERNRVGTAELVELCRRAGATPMLCVNFLGDGHRRFAHMREGNRTGDAREAADWVSYCNDPDNGTRRGHGAAAPYGVKLWQIGNETSYGDEGFTKAEAITHTIAFARAMRARDPSIQLIGWGDRGRSDDPSLWAGDMLRQAGEHLDYIAIHMMQQIPRRPGTVLRGRVYQDDPARAWAELLEISRGIEDRLVELEDAIAPQGTTIGIAVTEGHLSLDPHNANPILEEWLIGVYHARALNIYQRHGARVRIATAADFSGTRWTVVSVRLQVPGGISYLTPAGSVMRLFRRHNGQHAVAAGGVPSDLDIAASRTGDRIFLHVANLRYDGAVVATFAVDGQAIAGGRVLEIAPVSLRQAVTQDQPDVFAPKEKPIVPGPATTWRFPAASVSVVELDLQRD